MRLSAWQREILDALRRHEITPETSLLKRTRGRRALWITIDALKEKGFSITQITKDGRTFLAMK